MPEVREGGHPSDAQGQPPEDGGGLGGAGVFLRHLLAPLPDGPHEGGGGDPDDGRGHPRQGDAAADAARLDPDRILAEDAARLGISEYEHAKRFGLLGVTQLRDIRRWEQQGFDLERETDCE